MLSPSLLASAGKPGSPAFKAPQLRRPVSRGGRPASGLGRSRLSVVATSGGAAALKPRQAGATVIRVADPGASGSSPAWKVELGGSNSSSPTKRLAEEDIDSTAGPENRKVQPRASSRRVALARGSRSRGAAAETAR